MACSPVRSIIPSLKLGNYLSVQAHKPCSVYYLSIQTDLLINFVKPCFLRGFQLLYPPLCYIVYLRHRCLSLCITCTTFHIYPILSTRYSVMCKVYTGYCGTSEIEHGLCACTVDNPLAKARGLSLRTGAQPMLYLPLVPELNKDELG